MKRRLLAVYAVLHPGKTRGLAPWFTRECQAHGVDVSLSSIWRYLHGGTPTPEVLGVLGVLEADVILQLETTLEGLRR